MPFRAVRGGSRRHEQGQAGEARKRMGAALTPGHFLSPVSGPNPALQPVHAQLLTSNPEQAVGFWSAAVHAMASPVAASIRYPGWLVAPAWHTSRAVRSCTQLVEQQRLAHQLARRLTRARAIVAGAGGGDRGIRSTFGRAGVAADWAFLVSRERPPAHLTAPAAAAVAL